MKTKYSGDLSEALQFATDKARRAENQLSIARTLLRRSKAYVVAVAAESKHSAVREQAEILAGELAGFLEGE